MYAAAVAEPADLVAPTFSDVLDAHRRIAAHLPPTPLHRYPALDELVGCEVHVKHENHQPVCAFKVRGGVNLALRLSDDERRRGLIAVSTGNHGQSIAFGGRLVGAPVTIVVPEGANPGKVAAMRGLGADVVFHGHKFDDARARCERLADERGLRYVHSGDEPDLIAGVATEAVEMLRAEPHLDVLIVPIGGGSGAAGCCIAGKALRPDLRVIGVQSERSPAAHASFHAGEIVGRPDETFAEGLATGAGFSLPQRILREHLDDFRLVSDDAIRAAIVHYAEHAHTLVEAAGAAPLALALELRDELAGNRVGLVCSGGNIALAHLREAFGAAP